MSRLQHKRGRKSNYARSLNNPYWEKVARNVRLRDGHKCRICGSRYPLEVHHKRYKVNGVSIVGKELEYLDCLVTLCASCHEKVHKGILSI
ncbi:HNH endonuclease [Phocaeicola plebeius]|uniref:HNH endonuclease n=1 Tax=Phocaeicola plebeius TaxID=310297 RepID=UPI0026E9F6C9|nr:HNH endonuclease [Phocaeicola plebeius]